MGAVEMEASGRLEAPARLRSARGTSLWPSLRRPGCRSARARAPAAVARGLRGRLAGVALEEVASSRRRWGPASSECGPGPGRVSGAARARCWEGIEGGSGEMGRPWGRGGRRPGDRLGRGRGREGSVLRDRPGAAEGAFRALTSVEGPVGPGGTDAGVFNSRSCFAIDYLCSWDAVYERELQTFQEYGDTGEIWFGEESMSRLIRWMQKQKIPLDASVLDIGTGNGVFLVELVGTFSIHAKFGFSNITGIDYSPSAIQLSGNIIEKEGVSNIELKVEDFLNLSTKLSGFHICIDKGTFDAISLNPDNAIEKRKQYVKSLSRVLKVKGFFLITSCNWTKEELLTEFSEGFELFEELPTPSFSFGGRSGNSVAALVFQKL
ncbi:EEF1A lysine methyltransferase 2 [Galemys pyrenaicus]|uniref:EEF1A lysine methyltransferase 2 n=1 Tax=Galemys pyrenaicus TaxID=202257 RepID=A0A8J6DRS7_GALPY|nr:EEF1A lysine methyltransferase 2 [Galemys pyrenaicus]